MPAPKTDSRRDAIVGSSFLGDGLLACERDVVVVVEETVVDVERNVELILRGGGALFVEEAVDDGVVFRGAVEADKKAAVIFFGGGCAELFADAVGSVLSYIKVTAVF